LPAGLLGYNREQFLFSGATVLLSQLPRRTAAVVQSVDALDASDFVARRLRELGFVQGERVEVLALGPFSAEPLLVQVGFTRFALRRAEAARIRVEPGEPAGVGETPGVASDPVESQALAARSIASADA
jgi:ferrous iron transport protein A